ncbi:MAG: xanthine phosphoribosyltransferase [Oscillospiraceae bacterium]|nr:xanthine phosphoribosyltransferase [Oscillospiraceae bacterium]
MKLLEDMIRERGETRPGGIIKVDGFLNHRLDCELYRAIGAEFKRLFEDAGPTLILTVEASGIALAMTASLSMGIPMVFAKKSKTKNLDPDLLHASVVSFTHGGTSDVIVSRRYIAPTDRVLIIDDFLASGEASFGLISIVEQAGAKVVGIGIAIEKDFQEGGKKLRAAGYNLHSLARVTEDADGHIDFLPEE